MDSKILKGTNFVLAVSAEPVDGIPLTKMDLKLVWFTGTPPKIVDGKLQLTPKCQVVTPEQMVVVDENTYLSLVKTEIIGTGQIMCHVYASFIDTNWVDERKEYVRISTDIRTV